MRHRLVTTATTLVVGAIVTAASALAVDAPRRGSVATADALPTEHLVPDLVCPGPETLLVPSGASAQSPGAPVTVRVAAVDASTNTTGDRAAGATGVDRSGTGTLSLGPLSGRAPSSRTLSARLGGSAPGPSGTRSPDAPGQENATVRPATVLDTGRGAGAWRIHYGVDAASSSAALPLVGGLQLTAASSGPLRGIVARACATAIADTWLVGGSTVPGHRARLLLADPGQAAAVVDVDVLAAQGGPAAARAQGVVVPAGREIALFLDALAPGVDRLVVHVRARVGRVAATLHDSDQSGVAPHGADDVVASAAASRTQFVPGLRVDGPGSLVRVAVPGGSPAVVSVRLLGPAGEVALRQGVLTVPGGGVGDLSLSGVSAGAYTAVVRADEPVVAAGLSRCGRTTAEAGRSAGAALGGQQEFAWSPGVVPLAREGMAVLPDSSTRVSPTAVAASLQLSAVSVTSPGRAGGSARGSGGTASGSDGTGRTATARVRVVAVDGMPLLDRIVSVPAASTLTLALPARGLATLVQPLGPGSLVAEEVLTAAGGNGGLIGEVPVTVPAHRAAVASRAVADPRLLVR